MKLKKLFASVLSLSLCATVIADSPRKVQKLDDSTVLIKVKLTAPGEDGVPREGWVLGSGTYISKHCILTAAHLFPIDEDTKIDQVWIKINGVSAKAKIISESTQYDLAVIRTDLEGPAVELADTVKKGQSIWVLGNPLGIEATVTEGLASKIDFKIKKLYPVYIVTDAVVLPGNSGGGAFDSHGRLVGVLVMSTSMLGGLGASGLGLIVRIDYVKEYLESVNTLD